MIKIRFINFWRDAEIVQTNFFVPLIEKVFSDRVVIIKDLSPQVDLEIHSVFETQISLAKRAIQKGIRLSSKFYSPEYKEINPLVPRIKSNAKRRIWFTGENRRPPLVDNFEAFLSFDPRSYNAKNIYLPLWTLNIDWFGRSLMHGFVSKHPNQEELLLPRIFKSADVDNLKGVCAFIGAMEETRRSALYNISKSLDTQIFGRAVNKPVQDKIHTSRDFKFILAFENTVHPGYVTEKLLEASLTNAFPLYWGPPQVEYFNDNRYINLSNFENLESFNHEILRLNQNSEELACRLSQPIMLKAFDIEKVITDLRELLL